MFVIQVVLGILATCGLLGYVLLRTLKRTERLGHDPLYRRRTLRSFVAIWGVYWLTAVGMVIARKEPIQTLIGLPVVIVLFWVLLRSTRVDKRKSG